MDWSRHGVIFDMDGVLADTAQAHYESWQAVAERWGVPISYEAFHVTFGRPNHEIIPELFGRPVPEEDLDEVDRFKEQAYRDLIEEKVEPVAGAADLIEELHARGCRLGVGSSGPPENVALILRTLGVADRFDAVVTARDVDRGKPDPQVFLKAAAALGVEPARCLVIEDVPAGVRAAHGGGMKCLALTTTHPAASLRQAERVVADLSQITAADVAEMLRAPA